MSYRYVVKVNEVRNYSLHSELYEALGVADDFGTLTWGIPKGTLVEVWEKIEDAGYELLYQLTFIKEDQRRITYMHEDTRKFLEKKAEDWVSKMEEES